MKKTCSAAVLLCVFLLCSAAALAEALPQADRIAPDITALAKVRVSTSRKPIDVLFDGNYKTEWGDNSGGWIEFQLPDDSPCHTLYILTRGQPEKLYVEQKAGRKWQKIPSTSESFNTHCIPLEGLTNFRARVSGGDLRVMEVRLYGAGELPADVVNFTETTDKADLMILACHPDDDILWMGGLLPVYAGQLGMKVQPVYLTSRFHYRRCEAMDALWHCGVRFGPVFMGLSDVGKVHRAAVLYAWGGENSVIRAIAKQIRRFRPEVLVTQDLHGEYGHIQHCIMVECCIKAVELAANPSAYKMGDLPAWDVKKFYIHLYPENALTLDMDRPLSAFGGKTPGQVASEAFLYHVSQQNGKYEVAVDGTYDMKKYGLYRTAVGPDEAHDGLFEHIDGLYEREQAFYHSQP